MRNAATALLAVPIIAAIYVGALLRRSILSRVVLGLGLSAVLGAGVIGAGVPTVTTATPTTPIVPLTRAEFRTVVATGASVTEPVAIEFTTPMNKGSVASAVTVDPPTPVDLVWDTTGETLTISPRTTWTPGAFHTVSVQAGALAQSGQPLARPARAAFLTRQPVTAAIASTRPVGKRASVETSFAVTFAGPIDPATVADGIRLEPATPGTVKATGSPKGPVTYEFVPSKPLKPDTSYRLVVSGVRDADGLSLASRSIAVRTIKAPSVVRFRPREDASDAPRDAAISVRFTEPMDRQTTARAFSVELGGKAIKGTISWAESNKVLVFKPAKALPFGTAVVAKVVFTAKSANGAPLGHSVRAVFKTVAKPKVKPVAKPSASRVSGGGGGAVGGGSWGAVESYYLRLMNCTRTGGWITSSGACSSPGGRSVAALRIDSTISARVSRPYAKLLATSGACSHFIGGNPGNRLARAGFTSYRWAENIGCRSGNASSAVLGSHLFFQSEKSYRGGHYVNLMNTAYDRVGIGVWVSSGRVRLVVDFYHP
ncbi:MAG TPA: Ig-like domain-containing protein [Candidatus Limnocylindrales bacterium]|nr:Ig-like domain-containing protein [Candidatus Limnocylindrales bacterium]